MRANASTIGKLVCVALIVSPYFYQSFSKDAREARAVFRDIAQQRIVHIIVEPGRYHSLVNAPIVVSDKQVIAAFAKALSKLPTHLPNHPQVTKSVVLRIQLEDKVIGGELVASSNNGITFYYGGDVNSGWIYESYLVPKNRGLFELVEEVVRSSPTPITPPKDME